MGNRLATIDMGRKVGGCRAPFGGKDLGSPGPRPTSLPSGILIHPTVWPQYTNVTRQDRQRSDRISRTNLQTIAQKNEPFFHMKIARLSLNK